MTLLTAERALKIVIATVPNADRVSCADWFAVYKAFEQAVLAEVAGNGYRLVPVEPTEEMIHAGEYTKQGDRIWSLKQSYHAMLAAAPSLPEVGE